LSAAEQQAAVQRARHTREFERLQGQKAKSQADVLSYAEATLERASCDRCVFQDKGLCRRHAPFAGQAGAHWPAVQPSDWCGDFGE